ncbi:hypothetical protein [Bradyrhizobium liaoningense]
MLRRTLKCALLAMAIFSSAALLLAITHKGAGGESFYPNDHYVANARCIRHDYHGYFLHGCRRRCCARQALFACCRLDLWNIGLDNRERRLSVL